MKKAQIPDHLILQFVKLPQSIFGHLDWTTGAVRMNLSYEEYQKIANTPQWQQYQEVLLHEFFHGLQICSSGFLYNFTVELTYQLWENSLKMSSNELMLEKKFYEKIELSESTVKTMRNIFDSSKGISIIDLIESSAYINHNLMYDQEYDTTKYLNDRKLYSQFDNPYFSVYNFLESDFGIDAFYIIPAISFYSLLFKNPIKAFYTLRNQLIDQEFNDLQELIDIMDANVEKLMTTFEYLGSPLIDDIKNDALHPFYSQQLEGLKAKVSSKVIKSIMSNARNMTLPIYHECTRPIIFNCTEVFYPDDFNSPNFKEWDQSELIDTLKVMNALSYKAFDDHDIGLSFFNPGIQ